MQWVMLVNGWQKILIILRLGSRMMLKDVREVTKHTYNTIKFATLNYIHKNWVIGQQGRSQGGAKGAMAPPWSPKGPPSRCQKYGEGHNKGSVSIMKYI